MGEFYLITANRNVLLSFICSNQYTGILAVYKFCDLSPFPKPSCPECKVSICHFLNLRQIQFYYKIISFFVSFFFCYISFIVAVRKMSQNLNHHRAAGRKDDRLIWPRQVENICDQWCNGISTPAVFSSF